MIGVGVGRESEGLMIDSRVRGKIMVGHYL